MGKYDTMHSLGALVSDLSLRTINVVHLIQRKCVPPLAAQVQCRTQCLHVNIRRLDAFYHIFPGNFKTCERIYAKFKQHIAQLGVQEISHGF